MQNAHRRFGGEEGEMEQNLIDKASRLKQITIMLGNEIKDSNKFLNGLDNDFDKSKSFFESTIGRVGRLAKNGSWKMYFYLLLFSMFVFFVLYIVIKWF
jgi:blocked-early-in-transport protein 1